MSEPGTAIAASLVAAAILGIALLVLYWRNPEEVTRSSVQQASRARIENLGNGFYWCYDAHSVISNVRQDVVIHEHQRQLRRGEVLIAGDVVPYPIGFVIDLRSGTLKGDMPAQSYHHEGRTYRAKAGKVTIWCAPGVSVAGIVRQAKGVRRSA